MRTLVGNAAVFNSLSHDLGGFRERIAQGAFAQSLKKADVYFLNGHRPEIPVARQSAGNLELKETSEGLRFRVTPSDTTAGRDLVKLVDDGILDSMSFGFFVPDAESERFFEDRQGRIIREVLRAEIIEVSAVPFPAYPATSLRVESAATAPRSLEVVGGTRSNAQRRRIGKKRLEVGRMRKKAMGFR